MLRSERKRENVFAWALIIGIALLFIFGVPEAFKRLDKKIAAEEVIEYYPLMQHTILAGNSARVVYIERWTKPSDQTSCTDFEIVWPAGASQGYIDYMLEHAKGKQEHYFKQIGWWKKETTGGRER